MLQDGKTPRTALSTDIEGLASQFSELREDLAKLTHSVAAMAERRGRRMGSDITDGVGEAMHYVERKGKTAEAELEKSVANHPLVALGLAAGFGLVIGAMTRR
jgi:ElaB/YqjD/DUF883 family membrane-anchored ribosome-binding protein